MFSKLAIAATAALTLLSPVLADCTRNYTVVQGDICDWISKSQNVSTYQLAAVNVGIIDATCSNLEPGQNLCLGTTGQDCTETYVITETDSCGSILAQFPAVNSTILAQNNPNVDSACDNIYPGEVLCVATTVVAPPIPSGFFDNSDANVTWVPVQEGSDDDTGDLPYCDDVDDQ